MPLICLILSSLSLCFFSSVSLFSSVSIFSSASLFSIFSSASLFSSVSFLYVSILLSVSNNFSSSVSYFLPERSKSAKQKTGIAKKTTEPKWNHTFIYEDLSLSDLMARALELTIWDHDKLASNEFLGGIRLSLGMLLFFNFFIPLH